jgi:tetratricopeptide (TPR) repeat protein
VIVLLIPLVLLAAPARPTEGPAAARTVEGPAAREQARLCEGRPGEEGLTACRRAIELGLGPKRLEGVRELVARRLVSLKRWEELVEHFREDVALHPERAEAQLRLGSALLFALDRPEEALGPLREAVLLGTEGVEAQVLLGIALNALGRQPEAVAAFEDAERADPGLADRRPASRAVYEAARKAERWP